MNTSNYPILSLNKDFVKVDIISPDLIRLNIDQSFDQSNY